MPNWGTKRLFSKRWKTLLKIEKSTWHTQNEKTFWFHGLEELLLQEQPYYPKQVTVNDYLTKYQWHFLGNYIIS